MSRQSTRGAPFIAAIDFGTTSTGYAYARLPSTGQGLDVDSIQTDQCWTGEAGRGMEAPTTVLMDPREKFHSFGFEAEQKYKQLTLRNEHKSWFYFRHFKMKLHHEKNLTRDIMLTEAGGKQMKALHIFSEAIRYVKKQLLQRLNDREISARDIQWVITVPAIWREPAKQFMREAAKDAGLPRDQLTLALEPESAAIYCKELALQRVGGEAATIVRSFNPGEKYVVIDLGGGTVDTTVHEVQEDGKLKEIYAATGGPWGGEMVNKAYEDLLIKIVTREVLETFQKEYATEWLRMESEFEDKKKAFSTRSEDVDLNFSVELKNTFKEITGGSLQERFKISLCKDRIELINNVLMLKSGVMDELFQTATDEINGHIHKLLRNDKLKGVKSLLLVGGFSQSPVVSKAIRKRFSPAHSVIEPVSGGIAILKGAVMYGNDPNVIAARVSPFTYGVHTRSIYRIPRHSAHNPVILNDGRRVAEDVFNRHLTKGQVVYVGEPQPPISYKVSNVANKEVFWKLFKSTKEDPVFCDKENECTYLGKLTINIPADLITDMVLLKLNMTCKGTELEAKVTVGDQDVEVTNPIFDFLANEETGCDFEPM